MAIVLARLSPLDSGRSRPKFELLGGKVPIDLSHYSDFQLAKGAVFLVVCTVGWVCGSWFAYTTSTRRGERLRKRLEDRRHRKQQERVDKQVGHELAKFLDQVLSSGTKETR